MAGEGNGYPRWRDIERLERRIDTVEEGAKLQASWGARSNEQINELREDMADMKAAVKTVPVYHDRVDTLIAAVNRAKTAGWAVTGSLLILAATVIWQGGGG